MLKQELLPAFASGERLLVWSALLIGLAGCASGTCSDRQLLQPSASPTTLFSVDRQSEYDALFLEGGAIALWLEPCLDNDTRRLLPGTLCGTVIVSPGTRFAFLDAQVQVRDGAGATLRSIALRPKAFKIGVTEVGSSEPGQASWLVNRPYRLPGSWLPFVVFDEPYEAGPVELRLPQMAVNSVTTAFPPITLRPAVAKRCYRGPW